MLYEIYAAVGLNDDGVDAIYLYARLADLIDPDTTTDTTKSPDLTTKCDRDALLALADEMDERAPYGWYSGERDSLRDYARRIHEACGEVVE
ncbi:hypothetical protein [Olsenella sp. An293]|uniref:hypothetical protein n=1 Tax=Olsenella sp. An293 TaxID=1965626 RepID=UPI001180EFB2|nr:hypothetical protein [Olsenella sp. An293]